MNNSIHISFGVSSEYSKHCCITIRSILHNNPLRNFCFYIINDNFLPEYRSLFEQIGNDFNNVEINYIVPDNDFILSLGTSVKYISHHSWYRLLPASLLPSHVDKVICMDADMVVNGDLTLLWETNLDGYYCAGVEDVYIKHTKYAPKIGLTEKDLYVNAGLLLQNLKKIRKDDAISRLLSNAKEYKDSFAYMDQDIINFTFKGKIKSISPIWNFCSTNVATHPELISKAVVIHYTGEMKPWLLKDEKLTYYNPLCYLYHKYKQIFYPAQAEKNTPPVQKNDNIILPPPSLISVIIPIYNVEQHLRKCLESVVSQLETRIDIICVNDGSTDQSAKIAEEFASWDPRITIIHQKNAGLADARNTGLKYARSKYIAFIDSDDYWDKEMLKLALNAAESTNADFVISEIELVSDKPVKDDWCQLPWTGLTKLEQQYFTKINYPVWNKLFKREIIVKHGIEFPGGLLFEDSVFLWKYMLFSENFYAINKPLYYYVQRGSSIMGKINSSTSLRALDRLKGMEIVLDYYKINGQLENYAEQLIFFSIINFNSAYDFLPPDHKNDAISFYLNMMEKDLFPRCVYPPDEESKLILKKLEATKLYNDFSEFYRKRPKEDFVIPGSISEIIINPDYSKKKLLLAILKYFRKKTFRINIKRHKKIVILFGLTFLNKQEEPSQIISQKQIH